MCPDRLGSRAISYLSSAESSLNILHLLWCSHTYAIGSDRCSFVFWVAATQFHKNRANPVRLCSGPDCSLIYANGTYQQCSSTARAHTLEQHNARLGVSNEVLQSRERRTRSNSLSCSEASKSSRHRAHVSRNDSSCTISTVVSTQCRSLQ